MRRAIRSASFVSVLLLSAAAAAQEVPELKTDLQLDGGKVSVKVPEWKTTRSDAAVAVLEKARSEADPSFFMLLLAAEAGPTGETLEWDQVRVNIEKSASTGGSVLKLELKGEWALGPAGAKGQRMAGTLEVNKQLLSVELVCLVQHGRMLTVSVLGPQDKNGALVAEAVAKTATISQ